VTRLDLIIGDRDIMLDCSRLAASDRARTGEPPLSPAARRWLLGQAKMLGRWVDDV
jgi:hypothetical protein